MKPSLAACLLASLLACAGAKAPSGARAPTSAEAGDADAPPPPAASEVAIAGEEGGAQVAIAAPIETGAGILTAGVWDDNRDPAGFAAYAARMRASGGDLAAFTVDEQRAAAAAAAVPVGPRRELDVQLVVDTTGSMGDELGYLQRELVAIAAQLRVRFPDVTPRWSLVVYRDQGDAYVTRDLGFTRDHARLARALLDQAAGGGGDFPEAVIEAFATGLRHGWRREPEVARVMFWVADAPPHAGEGVAFARLVRAARDRGVHVYPIASSGIDDATEYQMRAAAQLTGGRYLFLTDDAGVGDAHAEPHLPCYQVTRLDRAMVRMIEIELRGAHVPAAPEDVVRRVGAPDEHGQCRVGERLVVAS